MNPWLAFKHRGAKGHVQQKETRQFDSFLFVCLLALVKKDKGHCRGINQTNKTAD